MKYYIIHKNQRQRKGKGVSYLNVSKSRNKLELNFIPLTNSENNHYLELEEIAKDILKILKDKGYNVFKELTRGK